MQTRARGAVIVVDVVRFVFENVDAAGEGERESRVESFGRIEKSACSPAVKPVATNAALDHESRRIVRLTANAVDVVCFGHPSLLFVWYFAHAH